MNSPTPVMLGDIAEFINGDRGKNYPSKSGFVPSGIPFINAGHLVNGEVDFADMNYISEDQFRKLGSGKTQRDDILYCLRGSLGKTAIVRHAGDAAIASSLVIIRPSKACCVRYIYRYLTSPLAESELRQYDNGSSQPNLSATSVKKYQVPLPPLVEQRRIAEVLDKADALRQKRRLALQKLDTLLQSVFLEMFGDAQQNPFSWKSVSFGEAVESTRLGLVRSSEAFGPDFDVPYVRMNSITRDGSLDLTTVQKTTATIQEIKDNRLNKGDFLFNTRNSKELVGKTAIFDGEGSYVFNNNIMRIRFKPAFDPYFVHSLFQTTKIKHELESRKSGTTNVFAIYYKNLQNVPILQPPTELQQKFGDKVKGIKRQRSALERNMGRLNDLFSALQYRAFKGELFETSMPSVGFEPENAWQQTSQ